MGRGRQWPFYQGRWPFYHASLKRLSNSAVARQTFGFGARIANFTISRVKNLSTAGPSANLQFREEIKGNLVERIYQRPGHVRI